MSALSCGRGGGQARTGALTGDPSQPECGFEVVDAPAGPARDACVDGDIVAGPVTIARKHGAPGEESLDLSLADDGRLCVTAVSSDPGGREAVRSGEVALDGEVLLELREFRRGETELRARRDAAAGSHTISAELNGPPGSSLTLEARHVPGGAPSPHHPIAGERIQVSDLRADPRVFSPNGNGIRDTTTLAAFVTFLPPPPDEGASTYVLEGLFEVAAGADCQPVVALPASAALDAATDATLAAVWDGRDAGGAVVPDGTYYYRLTVHAWRITPSGRMIHLDDIVTQIQALVVTSDDKPPVLVVDDPANQRAETFDDHYLILGRAMDESGIAGVTISGVDVDAELALIGDAFSYDAELPDLAEDATYISRAFDLTATDNFDNTVTVAVKITRVARSIAGQRLLYAVPGTPPADVAAALAAQGGTPVSYTPIMGLTIARFPSEAAAAAAAPALMATGLFARIETDDVIIVDRTPRDPWYSGFGSLNQEALDVIRAPAAWDITIGSRAVTIGVVDSGIDYRHPELVPNLFVNEMELPTDASFPDAQRILDANGDGLITFHDLNAPVNLGKVPGAPDEVQATDLIDGDIQVDIGLEGDLNGDGCPGVCGVDDDLDGRADLDDREVQATDYDQDITPLFGFDQDLATTGDNDPEDIALAAKDDDENGVPDDILGADFACDPDESVEGPNGGTNCMRLDTDNDPFDFEGHGTSCAGIIGATEDEFGPIFGDISVVGVNWEVRIVAARVTKGDSGNGDSGALSRAMAYMATLARRPKTQLKAVSLSMGSFREGRAPTPNEPLADVLDDSGVLLVASAGNDGVNLDSDPPSSHSPSSGENPNIISVAAHNDSDDLAGFSNRGTVQVDLAAPGENGFLDPFVLTTTPTDDCRWVWYEDLPFTLFGALCADGYGRFSGTSAAAPHVAGTIGLMASVNPGLPHITLRTLLLENVDTSPALEVATGGVLDARDAVNAAFLAPAPPVLTGFASDVDPAVSGDGRIIAFVSNRITPANVQGRPRIWLVANDGTGLTEIDPGSLLTTEIEPSLNADGSRLVFSSNREGGNFEIFVADIDLATLSVTSTRRRTFNGVDDRYAAISEDGAIIAFASSFDASGDTFGDFEVFRITANDDPALGAVINQSDGQITNDLTPAMPLAPELFDDRRPTLTPTGDVVVWVRFFNADAVGHGFNALGVADFRGGGPPTVGFINPVDTDKTAVTVGGPGPRIHFGRTIISGSPGVPVAFFSVALDGSDLQQQASGSQGGGFSADGSFFTSYWRSTTAPRGLRRTRFSTGATDDLAADEFPTNPPADTIVSRCDLAATIALLGAIDRSHPNCNPAMSRDGSVVVFVGAVQSLIVGAPLGDPPEDIYVFREGGGTIRVTPF